MLFNSFEFLVFFPVVTALYFLLPHRFRWFHLLAASCIFYMFFIPAYILILFLTIVVDYYAGMKIEQAKGHARKVWLWSSIVSTCLILFVFKYYNFFIGNFNLLFGLVGAEHQWRFLDIILPIGLSFHTFQSLSYVVEVYRGNQKAERNFGIYALYVMFYPQLVAGPIERPQNVLHQFYEKHKFSYFHAANGLKLMLWGLFKKVVVADRLALFVDPVFNNVHDYAGWPLIIAVVFFAVQIYCDFSGYSDMAIGAAEVMGFRLMKNFDRPYFSSSIQEFWSRWHISLSTWFRDYVYIPMGGNRVAVPRWYLNLLITFLISGFWHGANWTFVIWGGLHGIYLICALLLKRAGVKQPTSQTAWGRIFNIATTFILVCFAWIFFRAASFDDAMYVIRNLFAAPMVGGDAFDFVSISNKLNQFVLGILMILFLFSAEGWMYRKTGIRGIISCKPALVRYPLYYGLVIAIILLGVFSDNQFIYFQF